MLRSPLLLHIPHASTCIPDDARGDFVVDRDTLDAELLRLTDRYTDTLYGDGFPSAQIVAADVSRLVVDVEHFADDAHELCAAHGMGAVYVRTRAVRALRDHRRAFVSRGAAAHAGGRRRSAGDRHRHRRDAHERRTRRGGAHVLH